jgi:TRAP-type mannitol/chloroaromatic compound transport system permease large subunit
MYFGGLHVSMGLIRFMLLIGLMLTGMPISISLSLTVLTYMFTMTEVPITAVAPKLFTGIEKFEIMAIPFFILAGNSRRAAPEKRRAFPANCAALIRYDVYSTAGGRA